MNFAFVDIGELGWSLLLSGRIRWIKRNANDSVAVITYPDRRCLYEGIADVILDVPRDFYVKFDIHQQYCFGLYNIQPNALIAFFDGHIPKGYAIPGNFNFSCRSIFNDQTIFESYKYKRKFEGNKEILIFPRCRIGSNWRTCRNLPETFYVALVEELCREFPKLTIRTVGTGVGAYNINVGLPNYVNWVGKANGLQDMIDRCQIAMATVGAQSAPPKISLLQGVPTFMIGHEEKRHMVTDNWMGTKVGFYPIGRGSYSNINSADCIAKIMDFVRRCV